MTGPTLGPTLIIGGARSGKSALAERLATDSGREVVVVVTADAAAHAGDAEMIARIAHHRQQRPAHWQVVESPLHLAQTLGDQAAPGRHLVVDCLTVWLSNLLLHGSSLTEDAALGFEPGPLFEPERMALLDVIATLPGELTLIGNEVGHGIVPMGTLNRRFVDENGRLHQALAAHCERVWFVMAGCVLPLKGSLPRGH